jgi:hypothetical protein
VCEKDERAAIDFSSVHSPAGLIFYTRPESEYNEILLRTTCHRRKFGMYEQLIENKNDRRGGFFLTVPVQKKIVWVIELYFRRRRGMLSSAGNNHPICGLQFALWWQQLAVRAAWNRCDNFSRRWTFFLLSCVWLLLFATKRDKCFPSGDFDEENIATILFPAFGEHICSGCFNLRILIAIATDVSIVLCLHRVE